MRDATTRTDTKSWWKEPFRLVQTNLRQPDALYDQRALARETREFGATALLYNIGGIFAFYPTELELQAVNPMMKGDALGDAVEAAHAEGLALVGRFDMSKATRLAYDAHPEWFVHNAAGEALEYNGTYQACVNGDWYQDYAFRIMDEALGRYDVDGVFFNMFGYTNFDYSGRYFGICTCDRCRDRFKQMYGHALPEVENFTDPAYADYLEFQDRTALELRAKVYDHLHKIAPKVAMTGHRGKSDLIRMEVQRAVHRPQPEWPHQSGEQARWARAYAPHKNASSTSANFVDFAWRFHAETAAYHTLRMAQQLANGMTLDLYLLGVMDQDDKRPMAGVQELFQWHAGVEDAYRDLGSGARVGLYHSLKTNRYGRRDAGGEDVIKAAFFGTGAGFRGYFRALYEERIPFDFVLDEAVEGRTEGPGGFEALAGYDAIVMPGVTCLSDEEAAVLDAWVDQGGVLLITGETGQLDARGLRRDAPALASLPVEGPFTVREDMKGAYLRVSPDEMPLPDSRLVMLDGRFWEAKLRDGAETCMTLLPPQRFGPPELCFPDEESDAPGAVTRAHGKGKVVWLPWMPEVQYYRDSLPSHRTIMTDLITRHIPGAPAVLQGAGAVELTVQHQAGPGKSLVHVVNYGGQRNNLYEEAPALHGLRLGLRNAAGDTVTCLRSGKTLPLGAADGDGLR
ncbi:alpha-amylase family protein [Mesobacterium pallidum]|uniref:alpha-amylase family protein n=1 Tax=Mesobacterium pallidum TaxID=2872037 RepID=UPI001EE2BDDA|nr:alpha-amylase family protein [Mesobacterium pallidum]